MVEFTVHDDAPGDVHKTHDVDAVNTNNEYPLLHAVATVAFNINIIIIKNLFIILQMNIKRFQLDMLHNFLLHLVHNIH